LNEKYNGKTKMCMLSCHASLHHAPYKTQESYEENHILPSLIHNFIEN